MTTPNNAAAGASGDAAAGAASGAATGDVKAGEQNSAGKQPETLLGGDKAPADKAGDAGDSDKASGQKKDEVALTGAPENYAEFTAPEGYELDKAAVQEFLPIAKELNLSQAGAQKLIDWDIARAQKANEAQDKEYDALVTGWQKAVKEDKEVGGANFDAKLGLANGVIDKFGTPELKQALKTTMVGNHVEFVRLLSRIGEALGEGSIKTGSERSTSEKSTEEVLYPTMFKNKQ